MSDWLVVEVSPDCKKILNVLSSEKTHGDAFKAAQSLLGGPNQIRIIGQNQVEEWEYVWHRIQEKREFGFVMESGAVPNGNAIRKGAGARGIGRMVEYTPQETIDNRRQQLRSSPAVKVIQDFNIPDIATAPQVELTLEDAMARLEALKKAVG